MFKTELHCHSNDVSGCARVSTADIVKKFYDSGYSTVVLSNHFLDGTMQYVGANDWESLVDKFIGGYEKLKDEAKGKLNILLGMELRFKKCPNDFLVFGITKDFLLNNPNILDMSPQDFHKLANENGCLFIQAHPFRNGMNIINPDALDGVEVFNGHRGHDSRNDIAEMWADKFGLIKTSGTDFHYDYAPANGGILTEEEITSMSQLVEVLKNGNYTLLKD